MSKHQHIFNKHGKFVPTHQYSDMPQMRHETVIFLLLLLLLGVDILFLISEKRMLEFMIYVFNLTPQH